MREALRFIVALLFVFIVIFGSAVLTGVWFAIAVNAFNGMVQ